MSRALAVFGTGTGVGKSVTVTAIGRILSDKYKIAPFKSQVRITIICNSYMKFISAFCLNLYQ